jgi:hypothetical protein
MCCILYNNIEYILINNNRLNITSFEDNIYFTLSDIFLNANSANTAIGAHEFNITITNNFLPEVGGSIKYSDDLKNKQFMIRLHKWFCNIYPYDFTFEKEFDTQMGEIICNEEPYLTIKFINKKFESTYIK